VDDVDIVRETKLSIVLFGVVGTSILNAETGGLSLRPVIPNANSRRNKLLLAKPEEN